MIPKPYAPTPQEARADLARWSRGRKDLEELAAAAGESLPRGWVATTVDVLLSELERHEEANEGMVITDLEYVPPAVRGHR